MARYSRRRITWRDRPLYNTRIPFVDDMSLKKILHESVKTHGKGGGNRRKRGRKEIEKIHKEDRAATKKMRESMPDSGGLSQNTPRQNFKEQVEKNEHDIRNVFGSILMAGVPLKKLGLVGSAAKQTTKMMADYYIEMAASKLL